MMRALGVATWTLVIAACGGGSAVDITGVYMTTEHTLNEAGCSEGPAESTPPYFTIREEDVSFLDYGLYECTSPDPESCGGLGPPLYGFTDGDEDGWTGRSYGTAAGGGTCEFRIEEAQARYTDGSQDVIRVEATIFAEAFPLDTVSCTVDETRRREDDLPCAEFEVFVGTRAP